LDTRKINNVKKKKAYFSILHKKNLKQIWFTSQQHQSYWISEEEGLKMEKDLLCLSEIVLMW